MIHDTQKKHIRLGKEELYIPTFHHLAKMILIALLIAIAIAHLNIAQDQLNLNKCIAFNTTSDQVVNCYFNS